MHIYTIGFKIKIWLWHCFSISFQSILGSTIDSRFTNSSGKPPKYIHSTYRRLNIIKINRDHRGYNCNVTTLCKQCFFSGEKNQLLESNPGRFKLTWVWVVCTVQASVEAGRSNITFFQIEMYCMNINKYIYTNLFLKKLKIPRNSA